MIELSSLPSDTELQALYARLRHLYFRNGEQFWIPEVGAVIVEWSNRLTASAGICYPKRNTIRLSTHYHLAHPHDVEATLLHEMIHLVVPNHGPEFYAWIEAIRQKGGKVDRYAKARATAQAAPRWKYRCKRCGHEWGRYRRLRGGGRGYMHKGCGGQLAEVPV